MKIIRWILLNGVMATTAYYGLVEGVEGALNIALLIVWWHVFCAFIVCAKPELLAEEKRTIPASINVIFELSMIALFAWHNFVITAGFLVLALIMIEGSWINSKKQTGEENAN